jgi:ATP-dependent DNA helicase DinG
LPASGSNLLWDGGELPLDQPLDELVAQLDELIEWVSGIDEAETGLMRCRERACAAVARIDSIRGADEAAGLRWLGLSRLGFSLNYTPVDVSGGLRKLIESQPCAWVFTSATLAIAGNFSHFEMRMGLDEPRSMVVDSPFDYRRAGLLYLPGNMPEPASADYTRSFVNQLLPLIEASCGRAFLLFTSHRALREAARILREEIGVDYPLLVQGEAPRSKLLDQFVALDNPVLLGTSSFWEGVDIRGDGLVLVAIDKLPFASPGDPMLKARLEAIARNGGQPFRDYQLPQAVLGLKQGVGRLIRATDDSGIVAICDPRISSKGYGRKFLQSLPPFPVTDDEQQAAGFLASISGPLC